MFRVTDTHYAATWLLDERAPKVESPFGKRAGSFKQEFIDSESPAEEEVKIIRSKKFGMKPMFPEDACVQMELLGHTFFVFRNAETDEVNVVYKRKDGNYGLIEAEN